MKETKYGMAMSSPHSLVSAKDVDCESHSLPPMHDNIINCQLSPVAHLANEQEHNRHTNKQKIFKRKCNKRDDVR